MNVGVAFLYSKKTFSVALVEHLASLSSFPGTRGAHITVRPSYTKKQFQEVAMDI
jgi:hypothetical protein